MSTDFNYDETTIVTTGPTRPKNKNVPLDPRYRVETYADISKIPAPAVGELVFVLSDENNDNQQNIYVIKSLKASALGVADSLVDEVVPLKTFIGTDDINLSDYVTEDELNTSLSNKVDKVSGYSLVSDTEIARLANVDNYDDTELMNLIPDKTSDLENDSNFISSNDEIDATTLNGMVFSNPMTKEEYEALADKDPNIIYLVGDDSSIDGLPSYTVGDANKALIVNSTGTSVEWNDVNVDLDNYYTKSEVEERITDISTGGSVDLSSYATISYVDEAVNNIVIESGNVSFRPVIENEVFRVINEDNTTTVIYGSLIVSKTALTVNENETATFTIALDQAPTINQVVNISTANSNCRTDKNSLTFTSSNYATPQTITVTGNEDSSYDNKTDIITISSTGVSSKTISVTVINTDVPVTVSSISATYTQGDAVVYPTTSLNELKQNLEVIATYSDSSTKVITNYELSGTLSVGTSTITVTFEGKTDTFNVIVSEVATLNSISATYSQGNTVIYTDTEIETLKDDLIVKANYSDGNSVDVVEYTLNGTLTVGTSTITVTYQGLTTTFNVTVSALPVLESITANYNQGGKVVYNGGRLDDLKNDLVVTARYSNGNDVIITDYELSGVLEIGTSTITVSYQDKTAVFDVIVSEKTTSNENKKYISLEKVNDTEYLVLQLEDSDNDQHPEYITLNEITRYDTASYKFYVLNFNSNMGIYLRDYVDFSDPDILGLSEQTNFTSWINDTNEEESFINNGDLYVKINKSNVPENPSISDIFKYINNNILEHNALKIKSKVKTVLTVTDICSYIDESSNISSSADGNNVSIRTSFSPFGENTAISSRSVLNNYGWYGKPANATNANTIGFCILSPSANYKLCISIPKEHFVDNGLELNYENCRQVFNTYYSDIELYSIAEKVTT